MEAPIYFQVTSSHSTPHPKKQNYPLDNDNNEKQQHGN